MCVLFCAFQSFNIFNSYFCCCCICLKLQDVTVCMWLRMCVCVCVCVYVCVCVCALLCISVFQHFELLFHFCSCYICSKWVSSKIITIVIIYHHLLAIIIISITSPSYPSYRQMILNDPWNGFTWEQERKRQTDRQTDSQPAMPKYTRFTQPNKSTNQQINLNILIFNWQLLDTHTP